MRRNARRMVGQGIFSRKIKRSDVKEPCDRQQTWQSAPCQLHRKGGAMQDIDPKKRARVAVSDRLRAFFNDLKRQLGSDTEQFWNRVETKPNDDDDKKT
jgi:hypothetical protein